MTIRSVAQHDENDVPTLIGISSFDNVTPVAVAVDPINGRMLVELAVSSGSGAPSSTPSALGQFYIDTNGKKAYISMGTTNSSDWVILN